MLQIIRDRAQGLIAWIIVLLIIIPFALWGINQYFQNDADLSVARVNDAGIPARDFQLVYQQVQAFRKSLMGDNFNAAFMDENDMKRDALDRLIRREVLVQSAIDAGLRVGDSQLRQTILEHEQFQQNGKFDQELYLRILNAQGMSAGKFEASLQRDLLANQMLAGFAETALAMDYELDNIQRIRDQQRKIGYLTLKVDDYLDNAQVSDSEIADYYNAHLDRYAVPELVSVDYLELSASSLVRNIKVDEETLRKMYEEQSASFSVGEERHARHILIKVDENADDKAIEAARGKAQDVLSKIRAGGDFKKLAKKFSEDAGSAAEGGDLGFFARGVMVKPFEDSVFATPVDGVSDLVKSPFGFHIIKLEDIKTGHTKSFGEMRAQLEQEYKARKVDEHFFEQADLLANLTYESPNTLANAAQELSLPVNTTGLFSRDQGQGIASNPKVREAAFNNDVLEAGNNSETIELGQNHLVVLRIKERKPASTLPQEEVKGQIISQLRRDKAVDTAKSAGDSLLKRISNGKSVELLADEMKIKWKKTGFIGRNDATVTPEIVQAAFKIAKPVGSGPVSKGISLSSGDYAIVAVYETRDGNPAAVDEAARETLRASTMRTNGQQDSSSLYEGLKKRAKITEYPDRI